MPYFTKRSDFREERSCHPWDRSCHPCGGPVRGSVCVLCVALFLKTAVVCICFSKEAHVGELNEVLRVVAIIKQHHRDSLGNPLGNSLGVPREFPREIPREFPRESLGNP